MKTSGGSDAAKRRAGESAAETVTDGEVVGLGTGSTAAHAIRRLGDRVDSGLDIRGVATSFASRELAAECGIPLLDLDEAVGSDATGIDIAIDGADQVAVGEGESEVGPLIKGGGAAHAREKLVDASADRFLVVADPSKETPVLNRSVPVEVLPAGRSAVAEAVRAAGGEPTLRRAERKDGPVVTDNGNLVLDCAFGEIADPDALSTTLSTTPGVVEHGIFVGLADEVHVGTETGVRVARR
ncbi:ribose-5-phosphate isomerase RpiA [Halorubrum lacusprofundi]|jgi:ribose 5-phosphate isomerase A|uniref:Ribose-5-phosphate isomerase A n=1 Tax=Halorubrum lacusprofundi (strain ATCC 49239 / DSM 5036 / JCM 8891 / ACAM 34) TaxID=416348 RepID=RPIA_HALLT|nr:ribose-5-phosphate isomerase RpiA [Halorubrum lacusprofundi]B9LU09.1 RecName: Full=Ribose-5-phosphate isomerase A; AltName: Full=Phosphoriboisomerase A; Short=PRI [Halorubrum lacusprofundi ATCC 49239]ACM58203.1 ribose 5-phosphate isomerase [Halorubrum lacusprofundi ATCC 49239]MCG1006286.1 ribose-5-phosphate isomerase RpiA [Halorubrum lacusprofundi]